MSRPNRDIPPSPNQPDLEENHRPDGPETPRRRGVLVPAGVALVALLVAAAMVLPALLPALGLGEDKEGKETTKSSTGSTSSGSAAEADWEVRRDPDDPAALGKVDAPVVMVLWSDFQCSFCAKFARETEQELITRYVDKGVLRIEWRDFGYLGEESDLAARAARAAGLQGKFWEFHDVLYAAGIKPNTGKVTPAFLLGVAKQVGLDLDRFRIDADSAQVQAAVRKDFDEGVALGVNGTPAFLINGTPVMGAQPQDVFVSVIEAARKG